MPTDIPPSSKKNDNELHFAFSGDSNFSIAIGLAIFSLFHHLQSDKKCHIHILGDHISQNILADITKITNHYNGILEYHELKNYLPAALGTDRFPSVAYARFLLPDILPQGVDKVFYADADVMICDDLSVLWDIEMGDNLLAAVPDAGVRTRRYRHVLDNFAKALGKSRDNIQYFYSGQLLFNLEKWRKEKPHLVILEEARKGKREFPDQDLMNAICYGKIMELPQQYCCVPHLNHISNLYNKKTPSTSQKLVHFATASKPFILYPPLEPEYRRFYKLWMSSPWRNRIPYLPHKLRSGIAHGSFLCKTIAGATTLIIRIPYTLRIIWFLLSLLPSKTRIRLFSLFDWSPPEAEKQDK